ncbi:condensin complex protein MksE [Pseudomonas luteola]
MNIKTASAARDIQDELTNLLEITTKLRNGEMICRHHHGFFKEMRDHQDAYSILIEAFLGQKLTYHPAGFYYISEEESSNFSERSKAFAIVAFCIIEQLGDTGVDASQLIDRFSVIDDSFIDQLLKDQYRHLKQLGLHNRDELMKTLNSMAKMGFISFSEEILRPGFILLHSFHFYIDICKRITENTSPPQTQDVLIGEDA